jgi:hypothetical protein
MTVLGDVRIELLGRGREAFVIGFGIEDDSPVRDEQRASLQQVAHRDARARPRARRSDCRRRRSPRRRGAGRRSRAAVRAGQHGRRPRPRRAGDTGRARRIRRPPPPRRLSTGTRRQGAAVAGSTRPGRACAGSGSARRTPSSSPRHRESDTRRHPRRVRRGHPHDVHSRVVTRMPAGAPSMLGFARWRLQRELCDSELGRGSGCWYRGGDSCPLTGRAFDLEGATERLDAIAKALQATADGLVCAADPVVEDLDAQDL